MQVELVSPERILYSGDAEMVIARTVGGGDIAFLSGHAPFVGALEIATATVRTPEGDQVVAIHGGFIEVSGDTVTILSDVAELAEDIDVGRAERARREAEREHEAHDGEATAKLRRAHVRLNAVGGSASG